MAFNGYFIKFSATNTVLGGKFMEYLEISPNQIAAESSWTDLDGVQHFKALPHKSSKFEWQTPPLSMSEWRELMTLLQNNITDTSARACNVSFYDMESDTYKTGKIYIPNYTVRVYRHDSGKFYVDSTRFAIIEY